MGKVNEAEELQTCGALSVLACPHEPLSCAAPKSHAGSAQAERVVGIMCEAEGQTRPAEVVNRIALHKGAQALFWDRTSNWQGLCRSHHSWDKQAEERGFRKGRRIGVDGYPIE